MSDDSVPENAAQNPPARSELFLLFAKILITVMFMFPLAHYSMYGGDKIQETEVQNDTKMVNEPVVLQEAEATPAIKAKEQEMRVILPPFSPLPPIQETLAQLFEDYILNSTCCKPEDFGNEEKHRNPAEEVFYRKSVLFSDPRENIINFATVGIVLVSIFLTFLELYRAKQESPAKTKASLSRKCSLADLTIMKHQRKELTRRDSILECHQEGKQPAHYKKAPPLQRSSSTPVEPISELSTYNFGRSFDSRRCSIVDSYSTTDPTNSRLSLEGRRGSVLDRRGSVIDGKFTDRFDSTGRRISVDITSSPERKHHSRLVHRH